MSNIGLYKALDRANVKYDVVAVGDKYVVESMVKNGYNLGGEQSGHIINSNHSLFGDGLKTAMNILEVKEAYGPDAIAGFSSARTVNEDNYLFDKVSARGQSSIKYIYMEA